MRSETSSMNGDFEEGSICCDNKSCEKVLYEWFDEKDAPAEEREAFFAFSVKTRIHFSQHLTNFTLSGINPSYIFSIQEGHLGYIVDWDVLPLQLDFCSMECALAWLNNEKEDVLGRDFRPLKVKKQYGVLVQGSNPRDIKQLIADNPTRFDTVLVGNFSPTTAPKNQTKYKGGEKIKIAGKNYEVRYSNILRDDESGADIGVSMQSLMLKCPMPVRANSSYETCGQLIQILLDFAPSLWICPKCHGLMVIDQASNSRKHLNANLSRSISIGQLSGHIHCYFGKHDWGDKQFINWINGEIKPVVIAVGDPYQDGSMPDNFVSQMLIEINDVTNLFGSLIQ